MTRLCLGVGAAQARLAAARVAVLASLLVLGVAPRVRAQQMPQGCSGTGLTISPFVKFANGVDTSGVAVSPCETIVFAVSFTAGTGNVCCFQGGTVTITTPDGIPHDVTPAGGVPLKCPNDPVTNTLTVQYQVRSQDIDPVTGAVTASIHFKAGESFTEPPIMGVPSASTSAGPQAVAPCPPGTPCLISICDPNLQDASGRKGLCTTTNVTDSTPCSIDNAGNPVTAIPGSCKTPGCEAGECVQAQINVTDSTLCIDTDNNACTTAGCEAGSCVQTHVTTSCTNSTCQQCDASTGQCGPITPIPRQCVRHRHHPRHRRPG